MIWRHGTKLQASSVPNPESIKSIVSTDHGAVHGQTQPRIRDLFKTNGSHSRALIQRSRINLTLLYKRPHLPIFSDSALLPSDQGRLRLPPLSTFHLLFLIPKLPFSLLPSPNPKREGLGNPEDEDERLRSAAAAAVDGDAVPCSDGHDAAADGGGPPLSAAAVFALPSPPPAAAAAAAAGIDGG